MTFPDSCCCHQGYWKEINLGLCTIGVVSLLGQGRLVQSRRECFGTAPHESAWLHHCGGSLHCFVEAQIMEKVQNYSRYPNVTLHQLNEEWVHCLSTLYIRCSDHANCLLHASVIEADLRAVRSFISLFLKSIVFSMGFPSPSDTFPLFFSTLFLYSRSTLALTSVGIMLLWLQQQWSVTVHWVLNRHQIRSARKLATHRGSV